MKTDIYAGYGIEILKTVQYPTTIVRNHELPTTAPIGTVLMKDSSLYAFDGMHWISASENKTMTVQLDYKMTEVLLWARRKMEDEQKEAELLEKFPALKKAKEHYDAVKNIVSE